MSLNPSYLRNISPWASTVSSTEAATASSQT